MLPNLSFGQQSGQVIESNSAADARCDKMKAIVNLSGQQIARVRDIVGDRCDELFKKLDAGNRDGTLTEARQNGIRESLDFWSKIETALRDTVIIDGETQAAGPTMPYGEAQELAAFLATRRDSALRSSTGPRLLPRG